MTYGLKIKTWNGYYGKNGRTVEVTGFIVMKPRRSLIRLGLMAVVFESVISFMR